jgi:hypothetical protein
MTVFKKNFEIRYKALIYDNHVVMTLRRLDPGKTDAGGWISSGLIVINGEPGETLESVFVRAVKLWRVHRRAARHAA